MASTVLAIILFIMVSVQYPKAVGALPSWGRRVVDCGVSVWSAWGEWSSSSPDGTRTHSRSRQIFRYPKNGGAPCPSLTETGLDPWSIKDVQAVANNFHNNFLTGSLYRNVSINTRRRRQTTIPPRDTLFIIDMSGSITVSHYTLVKNKLAELIGVICGGIGLGVQNNRVAVITYSTRVVRNFNFEEYFTIESVQQAIRDLPQDRQATCTGDAIAYAHNVMFGSGQGLRPLGQSFKEVLVITDGMSNCGANIMTEAASLKMKAFVYALTVDGFGSQSAKDEIESMVSDSHADHIFALKNFQEFKVMVDFVIKYFSSDPCVPYAIG